MKYFLLVLILLPKFSFADIFSKSSEQTDLDQALAKDSKNFYYRGSYDYNAFAQVQSSPYELVKDGISLGCNRYNFHESLKNLFTKLEFNTVELETLMQQLSTSRLLVWQYSSPTLADLYKHLDTVGHLRLAMRYQQCTDLENTVNDPLVKLRKQSVIDCIKHQKGINDFNDMEAAFKSCFDRSGNDNPYSDLEDPSDGGIHVNGSINVTEKTLDRVNKNGEDVAMVKKILPQIYVSTDSVSVKSPNIQSRQLISQYRKGFLSTLIDVIKEYKSNKAINSQNLAVFSVFGVPMTEGQVRNIAMLDETTGYLAMNKVASELAYLKTIDQYLQASQMLDRVMMHPAIEPGYKTLLKSSADFVQGEISSLKEEKERLSQYADTMHFILDEADGRRLKAMAAMKEETVNEEEKGLFKINP